MFDDMIADMKFNKKLSSIVTELFLIVPKNIRINATHYFIMKISDKRELQK